MRKRVLAFLARLRDLVCAALGIATAADLDFVASTVAEMRPLVSAVDALTKALNVMTVCGGCGVIVARRSTTSMIRPTPALPRGLAVTAATPTLASPNINACVYCVPNLRGKGWRAIGQSVSA